MKATLLILSLLVVILPAWGQTRHRKAKPHQVGTAVSTAAAFPQLSTSLGNVLSNTLPKSFMQQLLDSSLTARDQHNTAYTIISFDFGYRHIDQTADSTGKPSTFRNYISWNFRGNRLDSLWRGRIKTELSSGDQLFYDHIIAERKDGEKFKAPALNFTIR